MTSYFLTKIESFGKIFHKVYKNLIITYMYLRNFLKKKKRKIKWTTCNYFTFNYYFVVLSVEALTTVKYMSNYCNTKHSIFVNNSIVLKSTNQLLTDSPGPQLHCTSDLVTDTGSRLLIHFISLSISIENDTPDKYVYVIAILKRYLSVNLYDTKFSE